MRIVIHVGTESPDSYALQRALPLDADRLEEAGVYVPHAGRPVPHVAKMALGWKKPNLDAWNALAAELDQLEGYDTVVVSHESLWSEPKRALLRLRGLFSGADLSIVLYLRDQADYLTYRVLDSQRHASQRFDLADEDARSAFIGRVTLDYLTAVQQLAEVFGRESLVVVPDSTGSRADYDELGDFYRRLGVDGPGREAAAMRADLLLTPGLAAALRRETSADGANYAALREVALRLSTEGIGARQILKPDEVRRIRRRHGLHNSQLSDRFLAGRLIEPAQPDTGLADHRTSEELRQLLVDHAQAAPLLTNDWLECPSTSVGPFATGWRFCELAPVARSPLVARIDGPVGTLRFRVPFDEENAAGPDGPVLNFETELDTALSCEVSVNGRSQGMIDIDMTASIPLGRDDKSQGVYEVEIRPEQAQPLEINSLRLRTTDLAMA
ncbi:MAG: hypothetical protein ACR2QE_12300 [Acidimicrobiales bacterium]